MSFVRIPLKNAGKRMLIAVDEMAATYSGVFAGLGGYSSAKEYFKMK